MNNEIILLKGAATNNCKGFRNIIKDFKNAGAIVTSDANIIAEYQYDEDERDDKMIDDEIVDFMKAISNGALLVVINQPNPLFSGENEDNKIVWPGYIKKLIDYGKKVEKWKDTQQVFFLNQNLYDETNHNQDKSYFTSYSVRVCGKIEIFAAYIKPRLGLVYDNKVNEDFVDEQQHIKGLPDYWRNCGYTVTKCMNAENEPFEYYERKVPGWLPPCDWIMVYKHGGLFNDFDMGPIKEAIKKYNTIFLFKELYKDMEKHGFYFKPFKFCVTTQYTIVEDAVETHLADTIVEQFYRVYLKEDTENDESI